MHPVVFWIGNFPIAWYGVLIAVGVLLGVILAARRARSVGVSPDLILDLAFFGVIIGFVGSRVFYIFTDLRTFVRDPLSMIFARQGYVFFGGLITTSIFALWFVRRTRSDPWQIADILAPSVPLAHAFGRAGCFMSGCCWGDICARGWEWIGVQFPRVLSPKTNEMVFSFAFHDHEVRGLLGPEATHSLPVYPVQLFEAGANLLLFVGLMLLWRRRQFRGQIFLGYLAAYSVVRFLLEFLRGDYDQEALFGALQRGQVSQALCAAAVGAAVIIYFRRRETPLESPTPPAATKPTEENRQPPTPKKTKEKRRRKR